MLKSIDNDAPVIWGDKPCSTPILAQYICKNTKKIKKKDFMDGFCLQGELDLTLFYKIEGYFDNLKSLMTENDRTLWGLKMIMTLNDLDS